MRQLVFGLDAAEWPLVQRWAADGRLPTFRRLLESGTHGTLTTTARFLPDTVWSCIYGGRNPATFDKYFYVQYDPRTADLRHVKDDSFTRRPFWKVLSDAGRRVGVVDPVKYPCTPDVHGFMIANWGAHATKAPRTSVPAELWPEVVRRIGRNPVGDVDRISDTAASRRDMRDRLLRGAAMRRELLRWLAGEQEWDLLFCGFSELHQAGHHFWHGHDATHERHQEAVEQGIADTLERVYVAVDAAMAAAWEAAGDDVLVMAVAGHGMGPLRHASWNLPEMLDLLGYGRGPARRAASGERVAKTGFWRMLKARLPGWLQYAIKARLPQRWQDELLFRWYAGDRDWQGWRAFAVPNNDTVGAIRVSVRGRDKDGRVAPGAEYEAILADLTAALRELTDPVSGRPVVLEVTRLHEICAGEYRDQLPDLCVLWDQSFPWTAVHSPRFGTLKLTNQDMRTGSHTARGFFVAAGPGIAAERRVEGHSIYDIAPTLISQAGVPLPGDLDGRPIPLVEHPVTA